MKNVFFVEGRVVFDQLISFVASGTELVKTGLSRVPRPCATFFRYTAFRSRTPAAPFQSLPQGKSAGSPHLLAEKNFKKTKNPPNQADCKTFFLL